MSHLKRYIALDLGGSARCVVGAFDGQTLSLEVIRRFKNPYVHALDQVYWDVLGLFGEVKHSLQQVVSHYGRSNLASLGVDTMRPTPPAYRPSSGRLKRPRWAIS